MEGLTRAGTVPGGRTHCDPDAIIPQFLPACATSFGILPYTLPTIGQTQYTGHPTLRLRNVISCTPASKGDAGQAG